MAIGYACIHIGSENSRLSSLRLKNAIEHNIRSVVEKNLDALKYILDYNMINNIRLFRISSDIIPFGSHPVNSIHWWQEYNIQLQHLSKKIMKSNIRLSMHPGQYTVLNSPKKDVHARAVADLEYHCRFLDSIGCAHNGKIVLHIGGIYSNKQDSIQRFIRRYNALDESIKNRLVIENDDKSYNIEDVLYISDQTGIPVVFDNLHHELNQPERQLGEYDWIDLCRETWGNNDGSQKIHYSQAKLDGRRGAHSDFINSSEFVRFYNGLHSKNLDIMLEVKDKNLSAIKCANLIQKDLPIKALEHEWARYKYFVLSRSATAYNSIRELLKNKAKPDALAFYNCLDEVFVLTENTGAEINAAQHIWGYVNDQAAEKEKRRFQNLIKKYSNNEISIRPIKNQLYLLAKSQGVSYLLDSLYFYL